MGRATPTWVPVVAVLILATLLVAVGRAVAVRSSPGPAAPAAPRADVREAPDYDRKRCLDQLDTLDTQSWLWRDAWGDAVEASSGKPQRWDLAEIRRSIRELEQVDVVVRRMDPEPPLRRVHGSLRRATTIALRNWGRVVAARPSPKNVGRTLRDLERARLLEYEARRILDHEDPCYS
jgi:hypothetical protein